MDLNFNAFVGRLVRNPEYHPAGRRGQAHATFTLAVNRVVPNEAGPQADYIPCSLWGEEPSRDFCEKRAKGDEVYVEGRLRTNSIPQASGPAHTIWEIRVEKVRYGRQSMKNLQPKPVETPTTRAVKQLSQEFDAPEEELDYAGED